MAHQAHPTPARLPLFQRLNSRRRAHDLAPPDRGDTARAIHDNSPTPARRHTPNQTLWRVHGRQTRAACVRLRHPADDRPPTPVAHDSWAQPATHHADCESPSGSREYPRRRPADPRPSPPAARCPGSRRRYSARRRRPPWRRARAAAPLARAPGKPHRASPRLGHVRLEADALRAVAADEKRVLGKCSRIIGNRAQQILQPLALLQPPEKDDVQLAIAYCAQRRDTAAKAVQIHAIGDDAILAREEARDELRRRWRDRDAPVQPPDIATQ